MSTTLSVFITFPCVHVQTLYVLYQTAAE